MVTVLLFEASAELLRSRLPRSESDLSGGKIVNADDTMVVASTTYWAEIYVNCIARAGEDYGLSRLNWRKVCALDAFMLDGSWDVEAGLNRRLGCARADI